MQRSPELVGVILAGGRSARMGGGDKCLLPLGDKTLLRHVIDRAQPQVARLLLNTNSNPRNFAGYELELLADNQPGFLGPLAGILSALEWLRRHDSECRYLASFASDTPFFPLDIVSQLQARLDTRRAEVVVISHRGRLQPLFALWSVELAQALRRSLSLEGAQKVSEWIGSRDAEIVEIDLTAWRNDKSFTLPLEESAVDPFLNINGPEDLARARQHYRTACC